MDNYQIGSLLRKLVNRLVRLKVDQTRDDFGLIMDHYFQFFIKVLSSTMDYSVPLQDEFVLISCIRDNLSFNRGNDALNTFDVLFKQLSNYPNTNQWGMLYLLFQLRSNRNAPSSKFLIEKVLKKPPEILQANNVHKLSETLTLNAPDLSSVNVMHCLSQIDFTPLLNDIMFVWQGIDGRYIVYDEKADLFQLDPNYQVSLSVRSLVLRICELGWIIRKISLWVDDVDKNLLENKYGGITLQSFKNAIEDEIRDYICTIAELEAHISNPKPGTHLTLRRLYVYMQSPIKKMKWILAIIDTMKEHSIDTNSSVSILRTLFDYRSYGSKIVNNLVDTLLSRSISPLIQFILKWVFDGVLEDPFYEFFIGKNEDIGSKSFWDSKYYIIQNNRTNLLSDRLTDMIFRTGKIINFLSSCCNDGNWIIRETSGYRKKADKLFFPPNFGTFKLMEDLVEKVDRIVNSRLLHILINENNILNHASVMKKSMLISSGDFIDSLFQLIRDQLDAPSLNIDRYSLIHKLQTAIHSTSISVDKEYTSRIDINISESIATGIGWDIFSLTYHVDNPISIVFTKETRIIYSNVFSFLFRIRRANIYMRELWQLQKIATNEAFIFEFDHIYHISQLIRTKIFSLLRCIENYIAYEVIEQSWHKLTKEINSASSVDDIIASHQRYVKLIEEGCILENNSETDNFLTELLSTTESFFHEQKIMYVHTAELAEDKQYAIDSEEYEEDEEISTFVRTVLFPPLKKTEEKVADLIGSLNTSKSIDMRNSKKANTWREIIERIGFLQ